MDIFRSIVQEVFFISLITGESSPFSQSGELEYVWLNQEAQSSKDAAIEKNDLIQQPNIDFLFK